MKLTEAELEEGRSYIRKASLHDLILWARVRRIPIDADLLRRTMEHAMQMDSGLAIKLFDTLFIDMDPEADRLADKIRIASTVAIRLLVALGCLGGIVYLIHLFW